jgi:hypothetical protein
MLSAPLSASPDIQTSMWLRPKVRSVQTLVALVVILATACASSGKDAARGPQGKKLQVTPAELQIKVRALADPFSGIIESAVWELWLTDEDPAWRQRILIWQINVINAIQQATFRPTPVAALFDTWALVEQLRDYTENASSTTATEQQRQIMFGAIGRMEARIYKIAVEAGGEEGAAEARRQIRLWVDENPIDQFATRTTTEAELARWTQRGNMGALATVKSLGATLDDVMARLDLYSEYIPKQASWHAQAVAYGWVGPNKTDGVFADLSKTATAFDRIASSLEGYPDVVADERQIVLSTIENEREQILGELLEKIAELELFIQDQRIDFVENQLSVEREAVFEAIALERAIVVAAAIKEREDTMDEFDEMIDGIVERSAVKVVDHFFLRAVQLLAILLVGMALIAVVVVLIWKR